MQTLETILYTPFDQTKPRAVGESYFAVHLIKSTLPDEKRVLLSSDDIDFIIRVDEMFEAQNKADKYYPPEVIDQMSDEICIYKDKYIDANYFRLNKATIDYLYAL